MDRRCDVLVIGGGLSGLAMAGAMARSGFSVIQADPSADEAMLAPAFDGRVSALTLASQRWLEGVGAWAALAPDAQAIHQVLVSDARAGKPASPLTLLFDAGERGDGAPLGYIAENRHIRASLAAVAQAAGVERLTDAVVALASGAQLGLARLAGGETVQAALTIAADGRDSPVRAMAGIGLAGWAYGQAGIVACVHHQRPHDGVAYEHFLPPGPFAILPMTGHRSSLVWTERTADAARMMDLPHADFEAEIARRFGPHLGAIRAEPLRWSYPLRLSLARSFIGRRLALVGDAAHAMHPLAGQNFNLGLKDIAALSEIAHDAAAIGLDIGSNAVLARYQRRRRFDCVGAAFAMDAINRVFSNDMPPLRLARDLGLACADAVAPLRRILMRLGTGEFS